MDLQTIAIIVLISVTIIVQISLTIFLVISFRNRGNNELRLDTEVIASFEAWLNQNITLYMTKYIEEKKGKELAKDDEISITSQFALDGIDYTSRNILRSIPDFYAVYMRQFYGEDKFVEAVYEKIRLVFVKYIEGERKRRLNEISK